MKSVESADDEGLKPLLECVFFFWYTLIYFLLIISVYYLPTQHLTHNLQHLKPLPKTHTRPPNDARARISPRVGTSPTTSPPVALRRSSYRTPCHLLRTVQVRSRPSSPSRAFESSMDGIRQCPSSMPPGGTTRNCGGLGCDAQEVEIITQGGCGADGSRLHGQ